VSRPSHIRFLSRTAPFYDHVVHPMGFRGLWEAVAERAAPDGEAPCLDVCTGTGGVAVALARRGVRVVGLDLADGMLRHARRKAAAAGIADRIHWARMDARRIGFADASFPLVVCAMALHEMAEGERDEVIRELQRVSSDRVLIADYRVPDAGWRRALFRTLRIFEYLESDDFESFTSLDIREHLEGVGFAVEAPLDTDAYRIWSCRVSNEELPL
jgi:ubiquinone/menaquinone biosynthesis C-methylase UbiE